MATPTETKPTPASDVNILLVGRTGNGKSSTGNSILHKKAFKAKGSTKSAEIELLRDTSTIDGTTVLVVDGPGIGDTGQDAPQDGRSMSDLAEEAFALADKNFNALVLVLKYGVRFTQQEKDSVKMVKDIFGEDIFRKFGIIAMTHGESFDLDVEDDDDTTFEAWCKDQTGDVQQLFKECNSRVMLFRNKTDDAAVKTAQYEQFMDMVGNIQKSQGKPYGKDDFAGAEIGRKKLKVMNKLPLLNKECEDFLDEITKRMEQLDQRGQQSPEKVLKELEDVRNNLLNFKQYLEREDGGTGVLQSLLLQVSIQETGIGSKINLQQRRNQAVSAGRETRPRRNVGGDGSEKGVVSAKYEDHDGAAGTWGWKRFVALLRKHRGLTFCIGSSVFVFVGYLLIYKPDSVKRIMSSVFLASLISPPHSNNSIPSKPKTAEIGDK